jgi:signal transduction histidine kinase
MDLDMNGDDRHTVGSASSPQGGAVDVDEARVLVVDDQPRNLEALEALLTQSGCRLVPAHSADEALLALLDQEFAAIILDVKMPGMGGLELAEIIKKRRRTRDVPILFLTAHMLDERDVLRGYNSGAVDYLTKPVHSDILKSKIAVFVDLYRRGRAVAQANESLRREVAERESAQQALQLVNIELERRVLERTEALERADRRKDEFLASLAHELRNPLAPIRSAVEILRLQNVTDADAAQARAVMIRQLDQMTRLIDDLLDVSRITSDKLDLQIDRVELSPIIAMAVETSRPLVLQRQHTLSVSAAQLPVELDADPARLAQAINNLLTNAAKYTPQGGHIALTTEVQNRQLTIRVADNGVGIDQVTLPRVFELFAQGDHAWRLGSGGLGVGLTLARRLVEMHGGTLEAESAGPGLGSTFIIRLPVPEPRAERPVQAEKHQVIQLDPRRILIVDDNVDAAEMLAVMLHGWGHDTRVVYDGPSALTAAEEFQPEIVLLDLGLPTLDGYETGRRLRETACGRAALVVAVTGWGQEQDVARSRAAGFDRHLVKPVSPQVLRTLVESAPRRVAI